MISSMIRIFAKSDTQTDGNHFRQYCRIDSTRHGLESTSPSPIEICFVCKDCTYVERNENAWVDSTNAWNKCKECADYAVVLLSHILYDLANGNHHTAITVNIDEIGANSFLNQRNKHIDLAKHFVRHVNQSKLCNIDSCTQLTELLAKLFDSIPAKNSLSNDLITFILSEEECCSNYSNCKWLKLFVLVEFILSTLKTNWLMLVYLRCATFNRGLF